MSTTSTMLKASFQVLRKHRRLFALPVLSIAAEAVVIASFTVPYVSARHGSLTGSARLTPTSDVLFAICGLVATTVSLFFTSALYLAVADAMNGDEVSLKSALRGAVQRLPTICAWAVASCTVSLLMRLVDRRVPVAAFVFDVAWSCAGFLALPVMVFEGAGVWKGLRRSVELFKRSWLDGAIGTVRLGALAVLLAIPALILFVAAIGTVDGPIIVLSVAVCLLWFGLCALAVSCLTGIYRVAVYRFAVSGVTPEQFASMDLGKAFR